MAALVAGYARESREPGQRALSVRRNSSPHTTARTAARNGTVPADHADDRQHEADDGDHGESAGRERELVGATLALTAREAGGGTAFEIGHAHIIACRRAAPSGTRAGAPTAIDVRAWRTRSRSTGLTKRFGATLAVEDLSFSVAAGRVVGFLGPNGAGKTTTLRALLGLVSPTSGSATIEGRRYVALPDPTGTVGAMLDGGMLHPGRSGRNHLRTLAAAAGIGRRARSTSCWSWSGCAEAAGRRTKGYSLGMRQRLGLAAALLGDPRVLVLDEPANGLDPQGIRWLRDFLRSLAAEGRAVLVSSHVLAEVAQTADEVVVIHKGRSVAQAPLDGADRRARGRHARRRARRRAARRAAARPTGRRSRADGDGALCVADRSGEQVGRVIAANAIVVSELTPVGQSLEEVFFELTDGAEGGPS